MLGIGNMVLWRDWHPEPDLGKLSQSPGLSDPRSVEAASVMCRFFCGPHAKKSAALAKQQKKRPKGKGKGKTVEESGEHTSCFYLSRPLQQHACASPAMATPSKHERWCVLSHPKLMLLAIIRAVCELLHEHCIV